jgi:hypothetical protein
MTLLDASSAAVPTDAALPVQVGAGVCVCRHGRVAHDHYRGGAECAVCPAGACGRYRANTPARRVFATLLAALSR